MQTRLEVPMENAKPIAYREVASSPEAVSSGTL